MGKKLRVVTIAAVILYGLFWLPWLVIKAKTTQEISYSANATPVAKVAIVFGGLHHQGEELTETNRERLLTAKELYDNQKVEGIVISNSRGAALSMKSFLENEGIPQEAITLDPNALTTLDTCKNELENRAEERSVIFVSHGYHMPRIIYQCNSEGLEGWGFVPDRLNLIEREKLPLYTKISIRLNRLHREAALTIVALLGAY